MIRKRHQSFPKCAPRVLQLGVLRVAPLNGLTQQTRYQAPPLLLPRTLVRSRARVYCVLVAQPVLVVAPPLCSALRENSAHLAVLLANSVLLGTFAQLAATGVHLAHPELRVLWALKVQHCVKPGHTVMRTAV